MTQVGSVNVGTLRIGYRRSGQGSPLLLLHGFFGDSRIWRWQLDALSADFAVVAWDCPGCGESTDPPAGFTLTDYADVLAEFVRALSLERPALIGLSFGGALALELAQHHREIPSALVVADGYAGWSGSFPPDVVQRRLEQSLPDLDLPRDQVAEKWVRGFLTDAAPPDLVEEVGHVIAGFHRHGMDAMIRALAYADLREGLDKIEAPTLLLWGDMDVRSPLTVAEDLHARIPESRLVVIPGAGHLSNAEKPDEFSREVREFLS